MAYPLIEAAWEIVQAFEAAEAGSALREAGSEIAKYKSAVDAINAHKMTESAPKEAGYYTDPEESGMTHYRPQMTRGGLYRDMHKVSPAGGGVSGKRKREHGMNASKAPQNTNSVSSKSKPLQTDYNIPGYNNALMVADKSQRPINIRLGKEYHCDGFRDFIKLFNRRGTVTNEFAFQIKSTTGQRNYHFQTFRHRWTANGTKSEFEVHAGTTEDPANAPFPTGTLVLTPASTTDNAVTGISSGPMITPVTGSLYHSNMTVSDLEDMCFNITNKQNLLLWQNYASSTTLSQRPYQPANLDGAAAAYDDHLLALPRIPTASNEHARISMPHQWNFNRYPPSTTSPIVKYETPPQMIPVFRNGSVLYNFSNKSSAPSRVEVIVYKLKKNQTFKYDTGDWTETQIKTATNLMPVALIEPKQRAYKDTEFNLIGTEDFSGRTSDGNEILTNPAVKFLPNLKIEAQGSQPFKEVHRQAVVLAAGDRAPINIVLGGRAINPVHIDYHHGKSATHPLPLYDDGAFFIAINVHGLSTTQFVATTATTPPIITEPYMNTFAAACVQCEAVYTENLQACRMKAEAGKHIFTRGGLDDIGSTSSGYGLVGASIVPQLAVVRTVTDAAPHSTQST